MQHVDRIGKLDGINRTKSATFAVFHHLQHTCTAKPFEHFRLLMLLASLSEMQSKAKSINHVLRKRLQIFLGRAHPKQRS